MGNGQGAMVDASAPVEDGRRARRQRNREAVVDALLELYQDGNLDPSSDEVAARAGLSPRSVFRYFDDVDDLCRAAVTRQLERVRPLADLTVGSGAPAPTRIQALAEQRAALFDAIGSVGQVSRLRAPFQPVLATQLTQARAFLRSQIREVMAAELAELGPTLGGQALAAADVVCSFESYQLLRTDQGLGRARAVAVMEHALGALFRVAR